MSALVFPVGHYLGPRHRDPRHPAAAGEPAGHQVRLGPSLRWLGTEPELLAWTLAHGLGELASEPPLTRTVLAEHGHWLAETDLAGSIAQLVERRLLVEVDPTGSGATEFARAHRLRALMLTLGRDSKDPDGFVLGLAGAPEVVLSTAGHRVWRAGQEAPSLWAACQAVAAADPAGGDAATLLPELLSELHGLLSAGVAYLDTVEEESNHAGFEIH